MLWALGEIREVAKLEVHIKPVVLRPEANVELRWRGRPLAPGVFEGEHYFIIEPAPESGVRFGHGERFTRLLVPLMALMGVIRNTLAGLE